MIEVNQVNLANRPLGDYINEPESAGFILSEEIHGCINDLQNLLADTQTSLDLVKVAEEALAKIESILYHMRDLSTRAAAENITSEERSDIQQEIAQHIVAIDQIATTAEAEAATIIKASTTHNHPSLNPKQIEPQGSISIVPKLAIDIANYYFHPAGFKLYL